MKIVAISDLHLGTRACQGYKLWKFLSKEDFDMLYLVGDVFDLEKGCPYWDVWQRLVVEIFQRLNQKGKLVYVTGNHDPLEYVDSIRPWELYGRTAAPLDPVEEAFIEIGSGLTSASVYVFHGDSVDEFYKNHRKISRVGGRMYDALVATNRGLNSLLDAVGLPGIVMSKHMKLAAKYCTGLFKKFPGLACQEAQDRGCTYVVCGHIHYPKIQVDEVSGITYINCGDWVENCTAAVCADGKWSIEKFD